MPLYEYECTACHRRTEKIQKFSDAPLTVCPHCGGELEKLIHAPAVSFKGGGWYADGYGNAKPSSASGASSSKPAESTSKPATDTSASSSGTTSTPASTASTTSSSQK